MMISYPLLLAATVAWLFIVIVSSLRCGLWFLGKIDLREEGSPSNGIIALGIGLAIFSYSIFLIAAVGLLSKLNIMIATSLWSLWLIAELMTILRRGNEHAEEKVQTAKLAWHSFFKGDRIFVTGGWFVLGCLVILNFIPAFVPETGWDGMAYHLALPKIYLQAGGFVFRPDIFHNLFPQFTEMLYLAGMIFPFGMAAKGVHFMMGLLTVFALYQLGKEFGKAEVGLLAGILFYAQYLVHMESTTAFIDLTIAAYAALGLLAVYRYLQSHNSRWLYLMMFFLGIIAANKWHGLIVLVLGGMIVLTYLWTWSSESRKIKLVQSSGMIFWGSLPVLPYMIRAWIMGKNPLWPLAYSVFGGKHWDTVFAEQVNTLVVNYAGATQGVLGFLRLPYDLIVHGAAFGVGGAELRWPLVGLFFVLLCSVLYRKREQVPASERLQGIQKVMIPLGFLGFIGIWFFSSPQIRFLMPLFPLTAWWVSDALVGMGRSGSAIQRYLVLSIGLLFFLFHPPIHRDTIQQINVLIGKTPPDIYCQHKIEHYAAVRFLNQKVRSHEKVLLFGENRGFYLDVAYLWGDPLLQKVIDYRGLGTVEALALELQNHNVGWVLYRSDVYDESYLAPDIVKMMTTMLGSFGEKKFDDGKVQLYQLNDSVHQLARRSE